MTMYRLKHIPSGLYFCPSREVKITTNLGGVFFAKTNLSKKGKVYQQKPALGLLSGRYYDHLKTLEHVNAQGFVLWKDTSKSFPVTQTEWGIEVVE